MAYIYLASPYTHKSELIRHKRYLEVAEVVARYLRKKLHVYSPIVHCHEIAKRFSLPKDFEFWSEYNYAMREQASCIHILELDGWMESRGVKAEIRYAMRNKIPLHMIPHPLVSAIRRGDYDHV